MRRPLYFAAMSILPSTGQSVTAAFLPDAHAQSDLAAIALRMNSLPRQSLAFTPWPAFSYKPAVQFSIAYMAGAILLNYFVAEKSIRCAATEINGPVWEDACVEFFVSFDDTGYYNLEFNCIGTALVGFGKEKAGRLLLPESVVRQVRCQATINRQPEGVTWELTAVIPLAVFVQHKLETLKGTVCKANFYKCGDALPEPHFLAWANIEAPAPDFHVPAFFGTLLFD